MKLLDVVTALGWGREGKSRSGAGCKIRRVPKQNWYGRIIRSVRPPVALSTTDREYLQEQVRMKYSNNRVQTESSPIKGVAARDVENFGQWPEGETRICRRQPLRLIIDGRAESSWIKKKFWRLSLINQTDQTARGKDGIYLRASDPPFPEAARRCFLTLFFRANYTLLTAGQKLGLRC